MNAQRHGSYSAETKALSRLLREHYALLEGLT